MFTKILIANRSEIASRIIATCAEMGIATVAVFTPADTDAPFVRAADEAVALPDDASYLDIDAIVDAATLTGASAVHPGYGFLSENGEFAAAVEARGITFIGPQSDTIATMGAKVEALELMSRVGIPVLASAVVPDGADVAPIGNDVGFPLLVKASSGGGGKGMRVVHDPAALADAVESARREAHASFGDPSVFLERFVEQARHIEVQIFGDHHGNVIHIYDRECSVQRRFQKVVEEAPAPFIADATRHGLWDAAVTAAGAVGYVGAGTVEFILEPDGRFSFLEMNTRLQVEHTVTEETTGLDLVRMQIEVADGGRLPPQTAVPPVVGHALEARVYAEKPKAGYAPSTGVIERFRVPAGVRVDAGVENGSRVTHHFDPMIAKVIATAPTRHEAARVLGMALARSEIHGVSTNRDLLVHALGDTGFLTGPIDTNWLDRLVPKVGDRDAAAMRASATAAVLAIAQSNRAEARVQASIPSGWRNIRSAPAKITLSSDDGPIEATYTIGTG
ncbi:MAG: biotin carboxylase N-terminal domain-containing protein, partial [Actinomycetota bacterium]